MSVTGSATSTNLNVLKGKIRSLAPYAVDPSLSVEGAAADAKAVGDALDKKVSYADIVDNLTTSNTDKPLSAKQGVALRNSVDSLRNEVNLELINVESDLETMRASVNGAENSASAAHDAAITAQDMADGKVAPDGSVPMTGNLNMDDNKVINVADPENDNDAVNKKYADENFGGRTLSFEVTLENDMWASTTGKAPYTQTIKVADILATDRAHYSVVYSSSTETALTEKEAFALVDDLDTGDGEVTFTCFEERPEIDLTIQMEVNR